MEKGLTHLPPLQLTADRVVFVAPHPDDETLGAGALLANLRRCGAEVIVMAVTDGENAYADHASLAEIRRQEQIAALGHLKIDSAQIHRLGLTDSAVALQREKVVDSLLPLVTSDTCILAPWIGDFHPDHEACGCGLHNRLHVERAQRCAGIFSGPGIAARRRQSANSISVFSISMTCSSRQN